MNRKYINILLILIVVVGLFAYNFLFSPTSYKSALEKIKDKSINSIVQKKFIDYNNHGIPYIVYTNDSIIIYREWENKINVGDSIIKPKGTLNLIFKNNSSVQNFNYEDVQDLELPIP